MAFTTSNVKSILVESYMEGLRTPSDSWAQAFTQRRDDQASLRLAATHGIGQVQAWDGVEDLPTTNVDALGSTTFAYSSRGVQVRIGKKDVRDVPGVREQASRKLGVAVASTYGSLAASVYDGIWATQTSFDGQYVISDSHTQATGGTRDNKLTSAFDRDALFAAILLARNWQSYHGLPHDLADLGWYLVCGPGLEQTVKEVLGSSLSGADMQVNAAMGAYNITPIIWSQVADADNWALVSKATVAAGEGPLLFWERQAPDYQVDIDQDSKATKISVDFDYAVGVLPTPDGIIGAAV